MIAHCGTGVRRGARRVSFTRSLPVALVVLPIVGAGFMIQMAATNTVLQTLVEDALRGRVMAFYTMAFLGTAPIGSLLAGVVADRIGAPMTIASAGWPVSWLRRGTASTAAAAPDCAPDLRRARDPACAGGRRCRTEDTVAVKSTGQLPTPDCQCPAG